MDVLTVAAKGNASSLLPVIAAVTCIQQSSKSKVSISYEDKETVGSQGAKVQLESAGKTINDDDILPYLRENYEVLQSGKSEQV